MKHKSLIGRSVLRKEGIPKVTGSACYIDDMHFPDMLYGATVRSSVPRGRITNIRFEPGIPWNEFAIVTAKDIPGENYVALIVNDQPCLADQFVNHGARKPSFFWLMRTSTCSRRRARLFVSSTSSLA